MTADDYGVAPPSSLGGVVPTRKRDGDAPGRPARRQSGKRRPPRNPEGVSPAPAKSDVKSADAKRILPGDNGEQHVDCLI
jgi:hypothetical protein